MNLKNKIAIVTGASQGIGLSIIKKLAKNGAFVIGTTKTKKKISIIKKTLNKNGTGKILNITSIYNIKKTFKKIYKKFGKIDILINNAGINKDKLLINMKEKNWEKVININLTSVFKISKIAIKYMIKKKYGRILNIGSIIGSIGNIGQSNYSAAKSGLIGFNKSLAKEVAKYGITSNVISPGFIITKMTKNIPKKYKKNILSNIPNKRFGLPKDIANIAVFLVSDKASYITGETIHVNGGLYMQ